MALRRGGSVTFLCYLFVEGVITGHLLIFLRGFCSYIDRCGDWI
jgi:hypothetical protein